MIRKLLAAAAGMAGYGLLVLNGQPAAPPEVFTAAQAAAGRTAYQNTCINCHTGTLIPPPGSMSMGQEIPPLAGARFMTKWGASTTSELSRRIEVAVGGFPPEGRDEKTYLNLAAYVLEVNGAKPGSRELTRDTSVVIRTTTPPHEAKADRH